MVPYPRLARFNYLQRPKTPLVCILRRNQGGGGVVKQPALNMYPLDKVNRVFVRIRTYQHETPRHPTQPHPIRPPAATHASRIHRDPATRGRTSRLEGRQQFGETELHRREATAHVAAIPGHRRGAQIRAVPHRGDHRERTEHAKGRRRRIRKMRRLHLREE